MAIRARLAAPPVEPPATWPFHAPKITSLPSHLLWGGDRRMEAETYLSSGYGLRLSIEERAAGWKRLNDIARVTMPNRTKATLVSPESGVPFLAATQVFDIRPMPRKWLAVGKIEHAKSLVPEPGTILVTRSGIVGRAIVAGDSVKGCLCSDDLLRVTPVESGDWGWLYAYLRSPQARAMMSGAQYGHIIKHLETEHLGALPVPVVRPEIASEFQRRCREVLDLRNAAHRLTLEAEQRFEQCLGPLKVKDWGESGFEARASALFTGRRRLEAIPHNPGVQAIREQLRASGRGFGSVQELGYDVWLPSRFRRIPAEDGVAFVDSGDLFEVNPEITKRIAEVDFGDVHNGRVQAGWLLLARSGQTYGINGSVVIATEALHDMIVSDHIVRVAPRADAKARVGYLLTALGHPVYGRPLVKTLAYGSSIPEIDPVDFANLHVVRLATEDETSIADLAEESAAQRARADVLERKLAEDAGKLIEKFLAGDTVSFVTTMPTITTAHPQGSSSALPEHARVRLRRAISSAGLTAGAEGTIVFIYEDGSCEVEFLAGRSRPAVQAVEPGDIELIEE